MHRKQNLDHTQAILGNYSWKHCRKCMNKDYMCSLCQDSFQLQFNSHSWVDDKYSETGSIYTFLFSNTANIFIHSSMRWLTKFCFFAPWILRRVLIDFRQRITNLAFVAPSTNIQYTHHNNESLRVLNKEISSRWLYQTHIRISSKEKTLKIEVHLKIIHRM